jgi:hypothetical protein
LLLNVVLGENRVDDFEYTRLVQVSVTESDGTIGEDRSEVNFGEVDGTERRTVVEETNESSTDFGTDHRLGLFC